MSTDTITLSTTVESNETIVIDVDLDVQETEKGLAKITGSFGNIKKVAEEIGKAVSNALNPVVDKLQIIEESMNLVTTAVNSASGNLDNLVGQMGEGQTTDQWLSGISSALGALGLVAQWASIATSVISTFSGALGMTGGAAASTSTAFTGLGTAAAATAGTVAATGGTAAIVIAAVAAVAVAIAALTVVVTYFKDELTVLFTEVLPQVFAPIIEFFQNHIFGIFESCKLKLDELALLFEDKSPKIMSLFETLGENVAFYWSFIEPILEQIRNKFGYVFDGIWNVVMTVIGYVIDIFYGFAEFFNGIFTGDIDRALGGLVSLFEGFIGALARLIGEGLRNVIQRIFDAISGIGTAIGNVWSFISKFFGNFILLFTDTKTAIKGIVNGIIGFINGMISSVVSGINIIIRALNKVHFDIPDWVPGLGGQSFRFNLNTLTAPKIPYLAKGAVLPANRPFLAVVGDQKHGTNIEAPLSTIQEAVAVVMDAHIAAMMSGFQALIAEQQATRNAVENIRVGDSVIGEAAARYNRRMAIAMGTY